MNRPRVSILMNVRNGSPYLREAIDSVLAQTFTDWEAILWDDRSTDDSANIIASYADDRIRYFLSPEDTVLARARALAIRQARGEWLAFLDQDDIWLPEKLKKQMALAESDPRVGLVYGRTVSFSSRCTERDYDHRHEYQPLPEGDIFERLFTACCFISMSSAMLRRSVFDQIGEIPAAVEVTPDYFLFVATARRYTARAVQEVVCRYRLHDGNMSHSTRRQIHKEILWLIDQWADSLDPRLVAHRRRVHATILAWTELSSLSTAGRGIARLLTQGSVGYLLQQPFARAFRAIRRRLRRPYWRDVAEQRSARNSDLPVAENPACPEGASHANAGRAQ